MFLSIYFNFNIWIYTDISVQVELMEVIAGHFKRQPQYFRSVITVQRIIDIMRRYYWFHPEPDSLGADNVINPSTGEIIGKRPEVAQIKKLRVTLLQLANTLAQDGFNTTEIRCMLLYLTNCPDHEQGVDVLQMLLALLNNSSRLKTNNSTCDNLIALSGLTPYIGLLKRKNHMLRAWSLKMIGKILEQSQGKRKEGLLGENCFATIKEYLQQYAFTEGTYYALMEVLLENVSVHAVKNPLSTEGVSPQLNG
jgi:hypothetical protein